MDNDSGLYHKAKGKVKVSYLNWVIGLGFVVLLAVIIFLAMDTEGLRVQFETNGGSAVQEQRVMFGEKVAEPESPVKPGQRFAGWYATPELDESWDFAEDVVETAMTLYAKWE
ncbi:MAG: InlB B-repeat-containing protein [Clostridiaceae bacterium]|nr:InlB B-repeat-containing protein [Clostridiaceae bacterium]